MRPSLHCLRLLTLLHLLALCSTSICPNSTLQDVTLLPNIPPEANFSLYILSMQWPFTVCATESNPTQACRAPPAFFTVRGLWPTSLTTSASPSCCGAPFHISNIMDIVPALRRFWPDLSPAANDTALWERQWLLHGSCSGMAMRTYFRKVLELSHRYSFLRELNANGVVVSAQKDHSYQVIQRAVNVATGGFQVRLRCRKKYGTVYLDALHVCLHRTRLSTIHCPDDCLVGEEDCCDSSALIRIPYWRHESAGDDNVWTPAVGGHHEGFNVGQIAGIIVLVGGVAAYLFKTFFDRRHDTQGSNSYQRIGL